METLVKKITYKSKSDVFHVVPIGDLHYGSSACDLPRFKALVKWIAETDNVYWIGMGDLSDCITTTDERFDPENVMSELRGRFQDIAMAQIEYLTKYLSPIADKCLGIIAGNHEHNILKRHHVDLIRELCKALGVENLGYEALIRLQFEHASGGAGRSFTLHAEHGSGGGGQVGSKLNRVGQRDLGYDADIFLQGHVHSKAASVKHRIFIPSGGLDFNDEGIARPVFKARKVAEVLTGCFLKKHVDLTQGKDQKYERSCITYAERGGYNPTAMGAVRIDFILSDGDFHIRV